jgi:hypothetical protein
MDVGQRDSGLDCLTLLLRFHQIAIDPAQIAHQFAGERIGTAQMLRCATQLKVKARAISETWAVSRSCHCRRSSSARTELASSLAKSPRTARSLAGHWTIRRDNVGRPQ